MPPWVTPSRVYWKRSWTIVGAISGAKRARAQAATAPRYDYIRDAQAATTKDGVSSMDQLVRDYMRALPPSAPQGQPQVSTPPVSAAPIAPAATR